MNWWPFGKRESPEPPPFIPGDPVQYVRDHFGEYGPRIAELVTPCIQFTRAPSEVSTEMRSRIGGDPEVPPDFVWPQWDGSPIQFLAQFNLSEFPPLNGSPLPTHGLLSIFNDQSAWGFDPKDKGSTRVYWFEQPNLRRAPAPNSRARKDRIREVALVPVKSHSFPDIGELCMIDLQLPEDIEDEYSELIRNLALQVGLPEHQILGHPYLVQNEMQKECQVVSNGLYAGDGSYLNDPRYPGLMGGKEREWLLLAQIDSDDAAELMIGDAGLLYVWVRARDLAERNFDNCWTILQSH